MKEWKADDPTDDGMGKSYHLFHRRRDKIKVVNKMNKEDKEYIELQQGLAAIVCVEKYVNMDKENKFPFSRHCFLGWKRSHREVKIFYEGAKFGAAQTHQMFRNSGWLKPAIQKKLDKEMKE